MKNKLFQGFGIFTLSEKIIRDESGCPISTSQEYVRLSLFENEIFRNICRQCKGLDRAKK
jgi:hypothetical protein